MGGLLRSRSDAATCQTLAPQWPIVEDAHVRLTRLAIDRVFLGCCRSISQTQKGGVICLSSCSPVFICFFLFLSVQASSTFMSFCQETCSLSWIFFVQSMEGLQWRRARPFETPNGGKCQSPDTHWKLSAEILKKCVES